MVELAVDSEIKAKFEQSKAAGTFVNLSDFEDKLHNAEFLNRLHNSVQGWYKEIRKVTTLEHNMENASAAQEVNFWDQMNRSLRYIKE